METRSDSRRTWINWQSAQRVFLWVHYQDPHGPYTPPGDRRSQFLDQERRLPDGRKILPASATVRGLGGIPTYQLLPGHFEAAYYRAGYDGEISYMDHEIGRLLAGWSSRGLLDETVVVFTSDHGEGLGENDYCFAHGDYLTEPLLHVPLLISVPNQDAGVRGNLVSLVDLLPTISALFGLAIPDGYPGRDLFAPDAKQRPAAAYSMAQPPDAPIPRFGSAKSGFRFVVAREKTGLRETFIKLADGSDDPAPPPEELIGELCTELNRIRERFPSRPVSPPAQLSPSEREKLRALGYASE